MNISFNPTKEIEINLNAVTDKSKTKVITEALERYFEIDEETRIEQNIRHYKNIISILEKSLVVIRQERKEKIENVPDEIKKTLEVFRERVVERLRGVIREARPSHTKKDISEGMDTEERTLLSGGVNTFLRHHKKEYTTSDIRKLLSIYTTYDEDIQKIKDPYVIK